MFLGALDGEYPFCVTGGLQISSACPGTIVATLQQPIGEYFQQSHIASYIGTSYLLSICCFTPLYGRLSDILGRKVKLTNRARLPM